MKVKDRPVFCAQGLQIFVQHLQCKWLIVQCLFIAGLVWLHSLHGPVFWWLDSQWHWCQGLPGGMRTNPGRGPAGIDGGVIACFWGGCSCAPFSLALVYAAFFDLFLTFSSHIGCTMLSVCLFFKCLSLSVCLFASLCLSCSPSHLIFFSAVKDAVDCLISPTIEAS